MSDATVTEALGEPLSPSQVNIYDLSANWYFRYVIGLSETTTGALSLRKAFHGTLARNFPPEERHHALISRCCSVAAYDENDYYDYNSINLGGNS
jgi:hypothetical protein